MAAAVVAATDATRYPDPAYTRLREALAHHHGVDVERIVPAGSASEFIFRLTAWARREGAGSVSLPRHGYGDYAAAAAAWKLEPAAWDAADLAWACDPSSPLGSAAAELDTPTGGITVLDRAYEPLRHEGRPPQAAAIDRCWQLFSPNKALGLTGVRGAYAIAPVGRAADAVQVDALAPSWVLGAHGVAMLTAWCDPATQAWLADSLPRLREWKARQVAVCESLGWRVLPSQANFFTCEAPVDAARLAGFRAQGIRLRDCTSFGLPGHLRLGVLPPPSQDALRAAWEALQ